MKPFRKEAQLILMFFVFLSVFTIYSNIGMDPEPVLSNSLNFNPPEALNLRPKLFREPASIPEISAPILTKDFFCGPQAKLSQDHVGKSLVMISFRLCPKLNLIQNMVLENQSNGFKAQIFKLEKNQFKTDFIQLNNGINYLKLEVVLKDGQKLQESLEILSGS